MWGQKASLTEEGLLGSGPTSGLILSHHLQGARRQPALDAHSARSRRNEWMKGLNLPAESRVHIGICKPTLLSAQTLRGNPTYTVSRYIV